MGFISILGNVIKPDSGCKGTSETVNYMIILKYLKVSLTSHLAFVSMPSGCPQIFEKNL